MENLNTPKNKTDQVENKNGFLDRAWKFVKKNKNKLLLAIGVVGAGIIAEQQDANAQMFKTRPLSEQNADKKAEGKKLDNTIVAIDKKTEETQKKEKQIDKETAEVNAQIAKLEGKKED